MARIDLVGSDLVVTVEGFNKLWALKSSLTIPLSNVRGATADPGIVKGPKGLRAPGTHVPGVIVAGTFHTADGRVFWDVRDPAKALVIELSGGDWARLVVEVDDPRATADLIERSKTPA